MDMGKEDRWTLYKTRYREGVAGFKILSESFLTLPGLYLTVRPSSFPSLLAFSVPQSRGIQLNFLRKLSTRHRTWAERKAVRLSPHLI